MSRIAGLQSPTSREQRTALLSTMLTASQSHANWQSRQDGADAVTLGWCGWHMPNITTTDTVLAVVDGCIYNRRELSTADTDAALLASLYLKHGFAQALCQLNGDFAAAVYDTQTQTLWLGRDRFGVKPLYYVARPACFAFASRLAALLTLPDVTSAVNRQFVALFAASHYRTFDNASEQSPFADIAQLPAAHMLRLRDGQLLLSQYWALEDRPDLTASEAGLAERYRALLLDAVAVRLAASHRPAFTLSGGMDSSSVLASAVRVSGSKQHAFSTVYSDKTYDESDDIKSMLASTVAQWHPVHIDVPDVLRTVQRMIAVHDEPVATATWLSHFQLCAETSQQGFGGLFGGLGGDELNAGEYEHFVYHFADLRAAGQEAQLAHEVRQWVHYHDHPIFRKSFAVMEDHLARLTDPNQAGRCLPDYHRLGRYLKALNREYFALDAFAPVMDHPFRSYLKNRTYQDICRETAPCCLRAEDRQTAAFGLDNFVPFFDHRLVEFMFRLPGGMKIRHGITKHLLRQAMRGILPEETRTRVKKTGWNAPAHVWFSGPGREPLLDLIHSQPFRERGIYDMAEVTRLVAEHEEIVTSGRLQDNHMMFLWQLVNLELWLQWAQDHNGYER